MTTKKGLLLKHKHKENFEVEYQGVVHLSKNVKVLGPRKDNKGVAKQKLEKVLRKFGIQVEWIN